MFGAVLGNNENAILCESGWLFGSEDVHIPWISKFYLAAVMNYEELKLSKNKGGIGPFWLIDNLLEGSEVRPEKRSVARNH